MFKTLKSTIESIKQELNGFIQHFRKSRKNAFQVVVFVRFLCFEKHIFFELAFPGAYSLALDGLAKAFVALLRVISLTSFGRHAGESAFCTGFTILARRTLPRA